MPKFLRYHFLMFFSVLAFLACNDSTTTEEPPLLPQSQITTTPSSTTVLPGSLPEGTSSVNLPLSSSLQNPVLSSSSLPSSSSVVQIDRLANITKPCESMPAPVTGGQTGYGTRYWDCCKQHCSWRENVNSDSDPWAVNKNCSIDNEEIEAFTWADGGITAIGTESGCTGGPAYTCYSQVPFAMCENLAYAYAAVPASSSDICGKCFQLDFDGGGKYDTKNTHQALKGKTMIVMATNIGHDVAGGQFDIMIPGGGVGIYNGCSEQWGVSNDQLGEQYGGLLTDCFKEIGYDRTPFFYQKCMREKCDAIFGSDPKFQDLYEGCVFISEWMLGADNPTFQYKEVQCPQELIDGYGSTINTTRDFQ